MSYAALPWWPSYLFKEVRWRIKRLQLLSANSPETSTKGEIVGVFNWKVRGSNNLILFFLFLFSFSPFFWTLIWIFRELRVDSNDSRFVRLRSRKALRFHSFFLHSYHLKSISLGFVLYSLVMQMRFFWSEELHGFFLIWFVSWKDRRLRRFLSNSLYPVTQIKLPSLSYGLL